MIGVEFHTSQKHIETSEAVGLRAIVTAHGLGRNGLISPVATEPSAHHDHQQIPEPTGQAKGVCPGFLLRLRSVWQVPVPGRLLVELRMNKPKTARDIMVTRLITLKPDMDVFHGIELLLKHRISGASVIDDEGKFLGVLSERCCMSVLVEGAYGQLPTTRIDAFMDRDVKTISEDTDLLAIAQIFRNAQTRRLPVLRDGKLVGQISRRDILRAAHQLMAVAPSTDSAILYLSSVNERSQAPI